MEIPRDTYNRRYLEGYRGELSGYEVARWHALHDLVAKSVKPGQAGKVLDYGAGSGLHVPLWMQLFPEAHLYFCDISDVALAQLAEKYSQFESNCIQVVNNKIALANDVFDVVVSVEVMEHVEDLSAYLTEINRLLKPHGYFIWTTPCANKFSIEHVYNILTGQIEPTNEGYRRWKWEDPTHLRRLTSREAKQLLEAHGFTDVGFRFRSHLFSFVCTKFCKGPFQKLGERLMLLDYSLFRRLPNGASMLGFARKK